VRRLELDQDWGVLVSDVTAGGPADRAGIRAGDVLVRLDGHAVTGVDELLRRLTDQALDRAVALSVIRNGGLLTIDATPAERRAVAPSTPAAR
jgi:S1-C subfamily serine protease